MICIVCPRGCRLKVNGGDDFTVTGNACSRGERYARDELLNPVRSISSTVKISGAIYRRCPVKTDRAIPKDKIFDAMALLDDVELVSPVREGEVVVENICGTGASFIITRDM